MKAGFQHLVFEDNYDTGTGDHYSLRQMCDQFYIKGACSSTCLSFHFALFLYCLNMPRLKDDTISSSHYLLGYWIWIRIL